MMLSSFSRHGQTFWRGSVLSAKFVGSIMLLMMLVKIWDSLYVRRAIKWRSRPVTGSADSVKALQPIADGVTLEKKTTWQEADTTEEIIERTFDSIPYYHCSEGEGVSALETRDIVLLHGAKYTKEDWKTSGVLKILCNYNHVNVLALDLPVSTEYKVLFQLLEGLAREKIITKLPLAALVTPSASGKAVVTAIQSDKVKTLGEGIARVWVPIACSDVRSLTAQQLRSVKESRFLSVWSVHGDQDEMGKTVSSKLQKEAGSEVSVFSGGHAFYLNVPHEFAMALTKRLEVENRMLRNAARFFTFHK